jgi:hypothetical protein
VIALKAGRARLALSKPPYTTESLRMAALVVGRKAEIFLSEEKGRFVVELKPAKKMKDADLRALAGEFLNECLNCVYRQEIIKAAPEIPQAILSYILEKRFPAAPPDPLEQLEPQVRLDREADIAALLKEAGGLG